MPDDDIDDLLGPAPVDYDDDDYSVEDDLPFASGGKDFKRSLAFSNVERALKGAPPDWFAKLLGIGRTTVYRKLVDVSPKHVSAKGAKYYDPKEALPYLVAPHDIKEVLARMNPKDLPERLRKDYWTARKAEQSVRENARDLWRSADVHRALGDVAKLVKDTITLWTDDVDEAVGMTAEQIEVLDRLSRDLLLKINHTVLQYVQNGVTRSQEAEFDEDDDE